LWILCVDAGPSFRLVRPGHEFGTGWLMLLTERPIVIDLR